MKFTIIAAAVMASVALAQDLTCSAGQEICGSGCITGTCCNADTALYCQPGEYCTVIDGVQGCCPEGATCTSKRQCSDFASPRCTGDNKDELCCTADLPFCDTATTTCVAQKPVLGGAAPSKPVIVATSTTQVHITVAPTSSLLPATAAPQPTTPAAPVENKPTTPAEGEEEEEECDSEEEDSEPVTRTNINTVTSTTSLPNCGATVPTPVLQEPECETYVYTKLVPVTTMWVDVPAPSSSSSSTRSAPSSAIVKPSSNSTKSIVMQTPSPSSPAQYTGAASSVKGGVAGVLVAVVAGLMML